LCNSREFVKRRQRLALYLVRHRWGLNVVPF
jgi:hypothetical protein